jgi:hypothetical protein
MFDIKNTYQTFDINKLIKLVYNILFLLLKFQIKKIISLFLSALHKHLLGLWEYLHLGVFL